MAPKKLLAQYRDQLRIKQYSPRTEETYTHWVREYIRYHNPDLDRGQVALHPSQMTVREINQFIIRLVVDRKISESTHTALAFGARGIRRSAPSSSSTAPSSKWTWRSPPTSPTPPAQSASPPSSPTPKPSKSSATCAAERGS